MADGLCARWSMVADEECARSLDGVPLAGWECVYWPWPEWGLPVYPSAAPAPIAHFLIPLSALLQRRSAPGAELSITGAAPAAART